MENVKQLVSTDTSTEIYSKSLVKDIGEVNNMVEKNNDNIYQQNYVDKHYSDVAMKTESNGKENSQLKDEETTLHINNMLTDDIIEHTNDAGLPEETTGASCAISSISENKSKCLNKPDIKRAKCTYGKKCYRSNSKHKLAVAHPGDSDYDSEEKDTNSSNKPYCKYGQSCYRTNLDHKKEFRHDATSSIQSGRYKPTRSLIRGVQNLVQGKRKRTIMNRSRSEDSLDYDDSFLNDGSSDDYEPTSSSSDSDSTNADDEIDDDLRRTVKEAKRFIKK